MGGPRLLPRLGRPARRHVADKFAELCLRCPTEAKDIEGLIDFALDRLDREYEPPKPAKARLGRMPMRLKVYP